LCRWEKLRNLARARPHQSQQGDAFEFLSLPPELRDAVYKHYVRSVFLGIGCTSESNIDGEEECLNFMMWDLGPSYSLQPNDLALLRTNKQVHIEASGMLYREISLTGDLSHYLPLYNDPCCTIPEIFKSSLEDYELLHADCRYVHDTIPVGEECIARIDPTVLSRFRKLELHLCWSAEFPCPGQYNTIRAFMDRLQAAIAIENATNPWPMVLYFGCHDPDSCYLRAPVSLNQKLERYKILRSTMDTLLWVFNDTEKLTVECCLVSWLAIVVSQY
jgi:hypothetical protein